jgi:3-isopropylmalate/(R)-2-methylmalate dehydratase small subunit
MEPFTRVTGPAAPLPRPNVDTDVIMPKQFLKGIDRSGLAEGFLFDLRFEAPGKPRSDFVLNRTGWEDTKFLVVGPNFGCGSSREHAVWGMVQLGIRGIIGPSFGGIFFDNCLRNGVLAVRLPATETEALLELVSEPARNRLTVDLPAQIITGDWDGRSIRFQIDPLRKAALLRGLDSIGTTLEHAEDIRRFENTYYAAHPWLS